MKQRYNRYLAGLAVAVLLMTLFLLYWLRERAIRETESYVQAAVAAFKQDELLYGMERRLVRFDQAERQAQRIKIGPIREVVVTRLVEGGEVPIVPFTMLAQFGPDWRERINTWRVEPLGDPERPFGRIYLEMDLSALKSMNWAIVALGLAIALMLFTLLARLWTQETSLTRTMIELNTRRAELIRVERLALAGQLAASLLHDLRKPVLHIKHSLDDLTDALGDFAPATEALQDLRRQTRLFFQMLAESQIERFVQSDRAGEEFVDIAPSLDLSLNLVRYERRAVEVVRREDDKLPPILAQPFRLIQLFSNLILNAYQAMNGRGILTIEARAERGGVAVDFTDNGPGIPADMAEQIFDPFFTTKPEGQGNGLGLSICRMIVEDLGGEISIVPRPAGGGATFRVWLPMARMED